jgi:hypothetical protein
MQHFAMLQDDHVVTYFQPPVGLQPLLAHTDRLLPPVVGAMHRAFWGWGKAGYSPGPVIAERVWFSQEGQIAFVVQASQSPRPLMQVGLGPDLAAWLVLLDKWVETFVVIARARAVWPVSELAGALSFLTPAFLPRSLVRQIPDNWARVAEALSIAVADGPLVGGSQDHHWSS